MHRNVENEKEKWLQWNSELILSDYFEASSNANRKGTWTAKPIQETQWSKLSLTKFCISAIGYYLYLQPRQRTGTVKIRRLNFISMDKNQVNKKLASAVRTPDTNVQALNCIIISFYSIKFISSFRFLPVHLLEALLQKTSREHWWMQSPAEQSLTSHHTSFSTLLLENLEYGDLLL